MPTAGTGPETGGEPLAPSSVRLRPTAAGKALLVFAGSALVLSWLRIGPVFAVAAVFELGIGVAAALATWRHASRLRIASPGPTTAFARERFPMPVVVVSRARRAASFDVLVTWRPGRRERAGAAAFLAAVTPGTPAAVEVRCPPLRRGRHPQGVIELESGFPLGLAVCRLVFELPDEVVVLPRLGSIRALSYGERVRSPATSQGDEGPGDEQEVYGVRAWREGESLRPVHWKLSARRGRLLVREFRSEPLPPVRVVLSTVVLAPSPASARDRDPFEEAVSLAATLVEHHVRRGHAVRLVVEGRTVDCRRHRGGLLRALRLLADVVPAPPGSTAPALAQGRRGELTFLVRAGGGGSETSGARRDSAVRILDAADPRTTAVFDRTRRPGAEAVAGIRQAT